jgi:O-antigen/teichoic acid export membrane protein
VVNRSALARRAGWNLVDQVISSLTNAALSVVVARSVDATAFGGFAVAFTVFAVLVGISRAVATTPLLIRSAGAEPGEFRSASAAALGTALSLGVLAGAGCLLAGAWFGGPAGSALVALAVVLPGLLVQDAWRQVFFAERRPAAAALNDTAWAVVQVVAVGALLLADVDAVGPLVLAWGGAAVAAAVLGIRQARNRPRPSATKGWLREHRDLTGVLLTEFGTQQGSMQGALLVIAAIGSLTAIGALRGVQVLLGVTNILLMAAVAFALPELSRRRDRLNARQWYGAAIGLSAVVAGLGFLWGLAFLLAPDALGYALLGDSWDGVSEILFASVLGNALLALGIGPATMLRAMDRARMTLVLNAVQCPLAFVAGVVGVLLWDVQGAVWGFAVAYAVMSPLWWIRLRREVRRFLAERVPS